MKCPFCESPERREGRDFTCGTFMRRGRNNVHTVAVQASACLTIQYTQLLAASQALIEITGAPTIREVVERVREMAKSKESKEAAP